MPQVHLEIVPAMLRDLVSLGVADACIRAGFPYHGIDVVDGRGQVIVRLETQRLAPAGMPAALGITQGAFRQILLQAALRTGTRLHLGCPVTARQGQGASALHAGAGSLPGDALVIAATGLESPLRRALFPRAPLLRSAAQSWWHVLVDRPLGLERPRFMAATGAKSLLVPVSSTQAGLACIHAGRMPSAQHELLPSLRHAFEASAGVEGTAVRKLDTRAVVTARPVCSGLLAPPWSAHGVLAVGDCAHVLPPHFSQQVPQAIEDAVVLQALLPVARSVAQLLEDFAARRIPRAKAMSQLIGQAARWDLAPSKDTDFLGLAHRLSDLALAGP